MTKRIRILLVDDNATFLRAATRFLMAQDGIVVVAAVTSGLEAARQAPDLMFQVALIDLAMPDLSGLELIRRVRAARSDVGIIALTVLDNPAYRAAALTAGAHAFVPKANLATELVPTILRVAASVTDVPIVEANGVGPGRADQADEGGRR